MVGSDSSTWSPDDTIRVLIATDIHLGYLENDPIRDEDSFVAFEEVLSFAVKCDVDLILLGGDLFHHAKPSPNCMYKCTDLIRKYCFGDKPVAIELLSDQTQNFARKIINYEDPNVNVSYPIFSIHGNHDDPVGQNSISSLDILSNGGLVNYFGKWTDYTHVRITPILLQKGDSRLALYGLSHLKDQRLSRLFQEKQVEMVKEEGHDWFNLLVLHQNRADRGPGNFIRQDILPTFLDLVVWGHEHDCEIMPMKGSRETDHFFVVQPGSTVATSLVAGEARPKHCALLEIHKNDFKLTPLPLETVRPFIFKTILLSDENLREGDVNENEKVQELLIQRVKEAIEEAHSTQKDPTKQILPLIRFNVLYDREEQNFNRIRFGQNFTGLVANPNEMIVMKRDKKVRERREVTSTGKVDVSNEAIDATDVEALLCAYYDAQPPEHRLQMLSVQLMTEAVRDFTIKQNDEILRNALESHRRRCISKLLESTAETEEEIIERLREYRDEVDAVDAEQLAALAAAPVNEKSIELSSDDEVLKPEVEVTGRGRGRNSRAMRTPRSRGGRGRSRGRVELEPEPPTPERRTPRRMAAQKSANWLQSVMDNQRKRRASSEIDDSD